MWISTGSVPSSAGRGGIGTGRPAWIQRHSRCRSCHRRCRKQPSFLFLRAETRVAAPTGRYAGHELIGFVAPAAAAAARHGDAPSPCPAPGPCVPPTGARHADCPTHQGKGRHRCRGRSRSSSPRTRLDLNRAGCLGSANRFQLRAGSYRCLILIGSKSRSSRRSCGPRTCPSSDETGTRASHRLVSASTSSN